MTAPQRIARLRIALADIEPEIWREVDVPLSITLKGLHDVIQAAMGWLDSHLYDFHAGTNIYGIPDPGWDFGEKVLDAKSFKLETFVARGVGAFEYIYDMGDDWLHLIAVKGIEAAAPDTKYPRLVAGEGRCPPEDVGGVPGYEEFVKAMSNKRTRAHRELVEWYGEIFKPQETDLLQLKLRVAAIAKQRRAGKASLRKLRDG